VRIEFADEAATGEHAVGNIEQSVKARGEGDIFQWAHVDEAETKTSRRNQARLHAARGADEENLGMMARDELVSDGEGRDDVAAGASAGDEDAERR
jgi:hypothetical protein